LSDINEYPNVIQEQEKRIEELTNRIKEKDRTIEEYEEALSKLSIKNVSDISSGFTEEELFNITHNQSVIIVPKEYVE
jgi:uncharacterized coiled-coil DUF342 family protein